MAQRQSKEFWFKHLQGWQQSGQTQATYCATQGLNIKTFNRWVGKERRAQDFEPKLTLVPVSIKAPTTRHTIQLHSPQGWRIELSGTALGELATLLRQLP